MFETLETRLTGDDAMAKLDELMRRKDSKKHDFDETISSGKSLVSKKDVTDTSPVKDKIKVKNDFLIYYFVLILNELILWIVFKYVLFFV